MKIWVDQTQEGKSQISGNELKDRDALEIIEEDILIKSKEISHILIIEMKKDN